MIRIRDLRAWEPEEAAEKAERRKKGEVFDEDKEAENGESKEQSDKLNQNEKEAVLLPIPEDEPPTIRINWSFLDAADERVERLSKARAKETKEREEKERKAKEAEQKEKEKAEKGESKDEKKEEKTESKEEKKDEKEDEEKESKVKFAEPEKDKEKETTPLGPDEVRVRLSLKVEEHTKVCLGSVCFCLIASWLLIYVVGFLRGLLRSSLRCQMLW